jgi:hypothetical protein
LQGKPAIFRPQFADQPESERRGGSKYGKVAVDQNASALSGAKVRCAPVSEDCYSYFVRFLVAVRCRIVCLCVRQYAAGCIRLRLRKLSCPFNNLARWLIQLNRIAV